jgi:hypothetical protein
LLAAAGDGVRVQTQKIAQQSVAPMAQPDGLQSGKQSSLLLVEQTVEQDYSGLEFVGGHLKRRRVDG